MRYTVYVCFSDWQAFQGSICSWAQSRKMTLPSKDVALKYVAWPVSWATTLVASVTMSSEETVTMLISSDVDASGQTSASSSALLPATTSRFMPALPWWTVLTWERRLSTRLKPRPHLSHRKGFSPAQDREGGVREEFKFLPRNFTPVWSYQCEWWCAWTDLPH